MEYHKMPKGERRETEDRAVEQRRLDVLVGIYAVGLTLGMDQTTGQMWLDGNQ